MTRFFIDHVTTYRKYCKSGKGAELAKLLSKFECILMPDDSFSDFVVLLKRKLSRLNDLYPRSKKFVLRKVGENLYIQPDDSVNPRPFESDYVAVIGVKRVKDVMLTTNLRLYFNDYEELEGGKE